MDYLYSLEESFYSKSDGGDAVCTFILSLYHNISGQLKPGGLSFGLS